MEKGIFLLLFVISNLTFITVVSSVSVSICHKKSAKDYVLLGFRDQSCPLSSALGEESAERRPHYVSVTEGDERWLQMGLDMIHQSKCDYVALLFYASWCPFSTSFTPIFHVVSSLYSSIPHISIKESSVKPSTLSKYGVHGFPTLLLLNSTMRARYRGTRTLASLVAFYRDVTGIESLDNTWPDKSVSVPHSGNQNDDAEPENCPFTWARSPENMLRQETYLTLAIVFVLLRLLHVIFPTLVVFTKYVWGRIPHNMRVESLSEHSVGYLSRAVQLCTNFKESNLQGGAMSARAWASKSLATVSIGDSSSSNRGSSASQ